MNESVMAFRAFGDGPYGFSFALNRTTWPVAGMCSGCFAKELAGLTKAAAAPAPSRRAKSRREMEIVFISATHKTIHCRLRDGIAPAGNARISRACVASRPKQSFFGLHASDRRRTEE